MGSLTLAIANEPIDELKYGRKFLINRFTKLFWCLNPVKTKFYSEFTFSRLNTTLNFNALDKSINTSTIAILISVTIL